MSKRSDAWAKEQANAAASNPPPIQDRPIGVVYVYHEWTWWARIFRRLERLFARLSEKGHSVLSYNLYGERIRPYYPFFHPEKRKRE